MPPRDIPRFDELDLVLVTARLQLRPFVEADAEALWPYVSDPELPRMMSWTAHTDLSQTVGFIRYLHDGFATGTAVGWAIVHEGRVAGCISLEGIRYELRAWRVDRAELGYWISPTLWNRGLMTEAGQAVIRFGFESLGLHKITVECIADNIGSRRVIEKLNFRLVGRRELDVWRHDQWWSVLQYELTASEWSDVTTTIRVQRRGSS